MDSRSLVGLVRLWPRFGTRRVRRLV